MSIVMYFLNMHYIFHYVQIKTTTAGQSTNKQTKSGL